MIRVLVLVLLAANLLYWGWSRWIREEHPRLVTPAATLATSVPAAAAPSPPCSTIGPVTDEVRAMELEQQLRDLQLLPLRRTVTADTPDGWWVYLVHADTAAQLRAVRTLQSAGISDAFAMADDPEFRVSIGVFRDEARSRSLAEAVRSLGLEPRVDERMRQQTTYWFELPGTAAAAVDLQALAAEGMDVGTLQVQACDAAPESSAATAEPTAPESEVAGEGADSGPDPGD